MENEMEYENEMENESEHILTVEDILLILKIMDNVESSSTDDEERMQIAELREKLGRLEVSC
jgi:hypothetical protein